MGMPEFEYSEKVETGESKGNPPSYSLGVAGYNVLEGPLLQNRQKVGENLRELATKGSSIICLQESSGTEWVSNYLPGWTTYYFRPPELHPVQGLAVLVKPDDIIGELVETKKFLLPRKNPLLDNFSPKNFRTPRPALSLTFALDHSRLPAELMTLFGGQEQARQILGDYLSISNAHSDVVVSPRFRGRQLQPVFDYLKDSPAKIQFFLGDFNKFDPASKRIIERLFRENGFVNGLQGIAYTARLTQGISDAHPWKSRMLRAVSIVTPLHMNLDGSYFKTPNTVQFDRNEVLDRLGSDHFPHVIYVGVRAPGKTSHDILDVPY